jgi:serine/threonine-protein kinase HipA
LSGHVSKLAFQDTSVKQKAREDCCQALSVSPSKKYQDDGGPGIADILRLLTASDTPAEDQRRFLNAQVVSLLIGATDGHAKNFSIAARLGNLQV